MNAFAKVNRSRTMLIAALACVTLAGSVSASAETHTGKAVSGVTIVTSSAISQFTTTSFASLPGGSAVIKVPAGKVQLVQVTFTADSSCQGPAGQNWCALLMLADGTEKSPASSGNYAFDGVGDGNDYFESHAMQRSILLTGGTHSIQVLGAVSLHGVNFFLDDWSLTITQYNNGK